MTMCSTTGELDVTELETAQLPPEVTGVTDLAGAAGAAVPRRGVLAGMASLPVLALLPGATSVAGAAAAGTAGVVRSALHVHASFSEGNSGLKNLASKSSLASMESQVATLAALGVDLCFFTDHDHRMGGHNVGMTIKPYLGT
ncbi:hypothetical protein XE97_24810, partial [Salmonella enterica subsp. enterica serovar Senftenberg]|nr:hypothetical protein [Salmonella enterica subsp. enterica serovar Senftenberg]